jgi:hypothetical protein
MGDLEGSERGRSRGEDIVGAIEDLLEIEAVKNVRIMYCQYFDAKDSDKLAGLFTEDAICEFDAAHGGDWVGRETIRKKFGEYDEGLPFTYLHAVTNPVVQLTGPETAHGRWYLLDLNVEEGAENPLALFGIYDDLYRKVDGNWMIERTRIDFLWPNRTVRGEKS